MYIPNIFLRPTASYLCLSFHYCYCLLLPSLFFHLTEGFPNLLLIILPKAYQCLDQCLNLFKEPVFYMADL